MGRQLIFIQNQNSRREVFFAGNCLLPPDISVVHSEEVPEVYIQDLMQRAKNTSILYIMTEPHLHYCGVGLFMFRFRWSLKL